MESIATGVNVSDHEAHCDGHLMTRSLLVASVID